MASLESRDRLSDKDLVQRVMDGQPDAFRILFERYRYFVYRQALDLLGNHERAEDATQEVFLTAYHNLHRLRDSAALGGWINSIARNQCLNIRRRENLQTVSLDQLVEDGFQPVASMTAIDVHERDRLIRQCLTKLSKNHREIIELRYTREFSYKKLADYLGISMSNVKSRLFHAHRAILKMLKKEDL